MSNELVRLLSSLIQWEFIGGMLRMLLYVFCPKAFMTMRDILMITGIFFIFAGMWVSKADITFGLTFFLLSLIPFGLSQFEYTHLQYATMMLSLIRFLMLALTTLFSLYQTGIYQYLF